MKKVISVWLVLILTFGLLFFLFHSSWHKSHIERIVKNEAIRIEKNYDYHWGREASPKEERLRIISNVFGCTFMLTLILGIPHILYRLIKRKKQ